jgi:tripartite-type tricarboxylate transporter receptor subunit TctC
MTFRFDKAVAFLLALGSASAAMAAAAPGYPERPVRLVLGFAPGGTSDALARVLTPKLHDALGRPWIVDNRSGASGNLSTEIVARANPDGHTVLLALSSQITTSPLLYKLSFSVEKDLRPVILIASAQYMLVAHPSVRRTTSGNSSKPRNRRAARSITRRSASAARITWPRSFSSCAPKST